MRGAVLLLLIAGVAHPLVVGYHVEPRMEKRDTSLFIDRPKPMAMLQACLG
jgi:hypothetical protein